MRFHKLTVSMIALGCWLIYSGFKPKKVHLPKDSDSAPSSATRLPYEVDNKLRTSFLVAAPAIEGRLSSYALRRSLEDPPTRYMSLFPYLDREGLLVKTHPDLVLLAWT